MLFPNKKFRRKIRGFIKTLFYARKIYKTAAKIGKNFRCGPNCTVSKTTYIGDFVRLNNVKISDGGPFVLIDTTLKDYRYTFCIENIERPLFFTEKIICAFANQTIPIYLGASKIDKFFNPDGIIKITTKTNIPKLVKQLTEEEYQNRLPAIMENYEKAKNYINPWDYMYKNYFK